jgi:hypothetical protein
MSPLPVIPYRHPFAPPALPGFIAHMGASDFRQSPLFLAFYTCPRVRPSLNVLCRISLVTAYSLCVARHGLRPRGGTLHSPCRTRSFCLLTRRRHRPIPSYEFRGSIPSRSALSVTIAPRHLLCLRIKHDVTTIPARLNSRPVVNSYLGRLPTCKITRPCQAATFDFSSVLRCLKTGDLELRPTQPVTQIQSVSSGTNYSVTLGQ